MITKQTIIDAVIEAVTNTNTKLTTEELTETEQTACTDAAAGILETVNPNHDYPSTPR